MSYANAPNSTAPLCACACACVPCGLAPRLLLCGLPPPRLLLGDVAAELEP